MTNNELKISLEAILESVKKQKEKNYKRNCGLSGVLNTPASKENDMYYNGQINILEFVLKNLEEEK